MSTLERFIVIGSRILALAVIISMVASPVNCLGWRNSGQPKGKTPEEHVFASPASLINTYAVSDAYASALIELRELESEPLCHRIAARLLVGNCQLLDGQNEATVLTDTERASRDFVDFFAASLAICDLERANFDIPAPCHKFRETVLANLPAPSKPQLHVTTAEIDKCLEGLARSDSSWSTWVSYRHKALRFCEAARAEHEKDQHIILHQKLAIILDRLTRQAENETQEHARNLERIFQKSHENADVMVAYMKNFETLALRLNTIISRALSDTTRMQVAVQNSMQGAKTLDDFIEALLPRWKLREEEMSRSYEVALKTATKVATQDVAEIAQALRAISVNSVSLQAQLRKSEDQVLSVARQQEAIQKTMENLQGIADVVLEKQIRQDKMLESTHNQTSNILSSLEVATMTVRTLHEPLLKLGTAVWWPYIICPVASLTLGSYGLQPSLTRNLALVGLGELAGFVLSLTRAPRNQEAASRLFSRSISLKKWHSRQASTDVDNGTFSSDMVSAGSDMET
ncbi:hypothetical protein E4U42_007083 [Claviceps africana]|uniref:Nuclear membrane fusion protein Kar5 n=1 Tax=Claviceps africana TaxID=83212 RepID=A0A8K0J269_9HYPO|nr:hypothetical protein E4U42_007083 [Claviceps africana]